MEQQLKQRLTALDAAKWRLFGLPINSLFSILNDLYVETDLDPDVSRWITETWLRVLFSRQSTNTIYNAGSHLRFKLKFADFFKQRLCLSSMISAKEITECLKRLQMYLLDSSVWPPEKYEIASLDHGVNTMLEESITNASENFALKNIILDIVSKTVTVDKTSVLDDKGVAWLSMGIPSSTDLNLIQEVISMDSSMESLNDIEAAFTELFEEIVHSDKMFSMTLLNERTAVWAPVLTVLDNLSVDDHEIKNCNMSPAEIAIPHEISTARQEFGEGSCRCLWDSYIAKIDADQKLIKKQPYQGSARARKEAMEQSRYSALSEVFPKWKITAIDSWKRLLEVCSEKYDESLLQERLSSEYRKWNQDVSELTLNWSAATSLTEYFDLIQNGVLKIEKRVNKVLDDITVILQNREKKPIIIINDKIKDCVVACVNAEAKEESRILEISISHNNYYKVLREKGESIVKRYTNGLVVGVKWMTIISAVLFYRRLEEIAPLVIQNNAEKSPKKISKKKKTSKVASRLSEDTISVSSTIEPISIVASQPAEGVHHLPIPCLCSCGGGSSCRSEQQLISSMNMNVMLQMKVMELEANVSSLVLELNLLRDSANHRSHAVADVVGADSLPADHFSKGRVWKHRSNTSISQQGLHIRGVGRGRGFGRGRGRVIDVAINDLNVSSLAISDQPPPGFEKAPDIPLGFE